MTENQGKEMFKILTNLVASVNAIRGDITEIRGDVTEIRGDITEIRGDLTEIRSVQAKHSKILRHLDAKTDSIALKVIEDSKRIDALEHESRKRVH